MSAFEIENHPADDAPRDEFMHWVRTLRAELDHAQRIEGIALEAALRVFAAAHPRGADSRAQALARLAVEAGESFALAWEARKHRR